MLNIYLDETVSNDRTHIGYGALITRLPIPDDIITKSLCELKADNEFTDKDLNTIQKSFFHASEDSQNAHSYLCSNIRDNMRGSFFAHIFDKSKSSINSKDNMFLGLSSIMSSTAIFLYREDINLIFEERNDLSFHELKNFITNIYNNAFKMGYDIPHIPQAIPNITFEIKDKSDKGLQCCDFILWTCLRKLTKSNCVWFQRLTPAFTSMYSPANSEYQGFYLSFKDEFETMIQRNYNFNIDLKKDLIIDLYELKDLYYSIESIVAKYHNFTFPSYLSHVEIKIHHLWNTRYTENMDRFIILAEVYLILFDTMPIYDENITKEKMIFLLKCKKLMSLFFWDNKMEFIPILHNLFFIRKNLLENKELTFD